MFLKPSILREQKAGPKIAAGPAEWRIAIRAI